MEYPVIEKDAIFFGGGGWFPWWVNRPETETGEVEIISTAQRRIWICDVHVLNRAQEMSKDRPKLPVIICLN